jgi:hypothetical protein
MKTASIVVTFDSNDDIVTAEVAVDGETVKTLDLEELEQSAIDLLCEYVLEDGGQSGEVLPMDKDLPLDSVLEIFDLTAMSDHPKEVVATADWVEEVEDDLLS